MRKLLASTPTLGTNNRWNTEDEIAFLRRLGTHADQGSVRPSYNGSYGKRRGRLDLLFAYQAAMPLRKNWGDVDQYEIEEEVAALISGALDRPVRVAVQ